MPSKASSATPSAIKMNTSEMSFGSSNDVWSTSFRHGIQVRPCLLPKGIHIVQTHMKIYIYMKTQTQIKNMQTQL